MAHVDGTVSQSDVYSSPRISGMSEGAQQYPQRILGYLEGQQPLDVLAATAGRLEHLIDAVSMATLRTRPAPDQWSIGEIVAHLADGEIVGAFRIRLILGSPGVPILAFDQVRWVMRGHYDARDPRRANSQFRRLRDANAQLLDSLDPEQWMHYGVHSERGQETIEQIVRMFAGHDLNHLRQIERILTITAS